MNDSGSDSSSDEEVFTSKRIRRSVAPAAASSTRSKRRSSSRAVEKDRAFERFKDLKNADDRLALLEAEADLEEETVYKTLDGDEYEDVVADRIAAPFVVDDDGTGYVDHGEEVFGQDDEDVEVLAAKLKKKKASKAAAAKTAQAQSKNIQALFAKARATKSAVGAKRAPDKPEIDEAAVAARVLGGVGGGANASTSEDAAALLLRKAAAKTAKKSRSGGAKKKSVLDEQAALMRAAMGDQAVEAVEAIEAASPAPVASVAPEEEEEDDFLANLRTKDMFVPVANENDENEDDAANNDELPQLSATAFVPNSGNKQVPTYADPVTGEHTTRLFWTDIYEAQWSAHGRLLMLGRVPIDQKAMHESSTIGETASVCFEVQNVQREMYVLPRTLCSQTGAPVSMADVQLEIQTLLLPLLKNKTKIRSKTVKRSYAFELEDVPRCETDYLLVKYPMACEKDRDSVKNALKEGGRTFARTFGTSQSATEQLVLDRDLMGPSWIDVKLSCVDSKGLSWCAFEGAASSAANIAKLHDSLSPPPMRALSLRVKTVVNQASHEHEIVLIAGTVVDNLSLLGDASQSGVSSAFCLVRAPGSNAGPGYPNACPEEFSQKAKSDSKWSNVVTIEATEKGMLSHFAALCHKLDPDALVGHNLLGFDLDVLTARMKSHKIGTFSKMGRVRRSKHPVGKRNGSGYYDDLCPGRLSIDTYSLAKEFWLGETQYSLAHLLFRKGLFDSMREEVQPNAVPVCFEKTNTLFGLATHTLQTTRLTIRLMFRLQALPLSYEITCLNGNLWNRTLSGGRAERNEYLLLHSFKSRRYVVPDKEFVRRAKGKKRRQKASYAGGLVLEPKKGLYDTFVLLLDFNSLYPSIIQEYNLCFTTVDRVGREDSFEVSLPPEEDRKIEAVLPKVIRSLVERRGQVKQLMKNASSDREKSQFDVRQKALKITANSMYGCLGFSSSRFYARAIAALVTQTGRTILQETVELSNANGYQVVYGDTDSIMVNTREKGELDNLPNVFKIAKTVVGLVNAKYKKLEIDIDGVFARMLLLKKKKYAALTVENFSEANPTELKCKVERKGIDLVRRDWCGLSKAVGHKVLNTLLSGEPHDEIQRRVLEHTAECAKSVRENTAPLDAYVITKGLSKAPKDYPDADSQPHLQVALAMIKRGRTVASGDFVPYVICTTKRFDNAKDSYASRAFHPDEIRASPSTLVVDQEWYLSNQVLPPLHRLCEVMQELGQRELAVALTLDASKFTRGSDSRGSGDFYDDLFDMGPVEVSDEERFKQCERIKFACDECSHEYEHPGVFWLPDERLAQGGVESLAKVTNGRECPKCGAAQELTKISHFVEASARASVKKYYQGWLISEDNDDGLRTRQQSCDHNHLINDGRHVNLKREFPAKALYAQLSYLESLVDCEKALLKLKEKQRQQEDSSHNAAKRLKPTALSFAPVELTKEESVALKKTEQMIKASYLNKSAYAWIKPALFAEVFEVA